MSEPFSRGNQFQVASDHWKGPSRAMLRKAHRAEVIPGFPVSAPFTSMDEVKQYLSGDKLQCLLCGKEFRNVGIHVSHQHGMPADEYREKYGIPYTVGLCCASSAERYRESTSRYLDRPGRREELLKNAAMGRSKPRLFRAPAASVMNQRVSRITELREYIKCCQCGADLQQIFNAPAKCEACKSTQKSHPQSPDNQEYRREIAKRHYYKDLEESRRSLRIRAAKVREKKRAQKVKSTSEGLAI